MASAQELRYGGQEGATHGYSRTQVDRVTQTVDGRPQTIDIQSYWGFHATVRERGEGSLTYEIVHDSLSIVSTPEVAAPDLAGVYGEPVLVVLGERGEVREVRLPDSLPASAGRLDLVTTYRTFFPVLPEAPAEPGTTWQDTIRVDTSQNGMDIHVTRINTYVAGESVEHEGRDAIEVEYTSTVDLEGSGAQQGSSVDLSGSGTVEGVYYFSPDEGLFLGGEETSELTMNAFVSAGEENVLIPIVQRRTERIELE